MTEHATIVADNRHVFAGAGLAVASTVSGALPRMVLLGSQIETWNTLVNLEGKEIEVAGLKVVFSRQASSPARRFRHTLRWVDVIGTQKVLVTLQTFPFSETHGAELDAESLDTLPGHLGAALESSALALIADRLSKIGLKARTVEPGADVPSADSVDVVLRIGGLFSGEVVLRLCGTPSALASLVGIDGILALAPVSPLTETLKVPVVARLEDVVLTAAEVAGLEFGDVILLDGSPRSNLTLSVMRWRFGVERVPDGWMIREITMEGDHRDAGGDRPPLLEGTKQDDSAMPDLSQLPVVIAFELATMEVPIGQLAAWSPGALVDLGVADVSSGLSVTARIGGRQMARGDLVRIDDRFAVRLSSVGPWSSAKGNGT